MSPHRIHSVKHYKISDHILILILGYVDPLTLWRACQGFQRVYALVMEFQPLRYKFELAISGMRDGDMTRTHVPAYARLELLLDYKMNWPRLEWTHENRFQITLPAIVGCSGGFIHQLHLHGAYSTLQLTELPSCRTIKPPSLTRHLRYATPPCECVTVDYSQALIVACHMFSQNGKIGVQCHIRDLWTFSKHSQTLESSYDFDTMIQGRVTCASVAINGVNIIVSVAFLGGRVMHILVNWQTSAFARLDFNDVQLIDGHYMLTLSQKGSSPSLCLYDISLLPTITLVREFELPTTWRPYRLSFCHDTSTTVDHARLSGALFYTTPENRIVAINAKSHDGRHAYHSCLFIQQMCLKRSRKDHIRVSWSQWSPMCLIKDLAAISYSVQGPYVVGSRALILEHRRSTRGNDAILHTIDFSSSCESIVCSEDWVWKGPRALLAPSEYQRAIPPSTMKGASVEDIRVTEDNIILFSEAQQGVRQVAVLTFGPQPKRVRP